MSTEPPRRSGEVVNRFVGTLRQSFVRGVALSVPLIVTLLVFGFAARALSRVVGPIARGITFLPGVGDVPVFVLELVVLVLLFCSVLTVGFVAERRTGQESRLARTVDDLIAGIPGLGSVYTGVQQLSDVLLSEDTDSFHEVKLLEFPGEGSYSSAI